MQWHSVDWSQELFRISVSLHLYTLVAAVFMGTEIIKISTSPAYRMVHTRKIHYRYQNFHSSCNKKHLWGQ